MKKKTVFTGVGALIMCISMAAPICAAQTEVSVGVAETAPKVVSVDVPTNFAMAVVADKNKPTEAPQLLLGSTTVTQEGKAEMAFVNKGQTKAEILDATVNNVVGSGWKLTNLTPTAAQEMQLSVGSLALNGPINGGGSGKLEGTPIELEMNSTSHVQVKAAIGGTNADYTKKADAVAYHITWTIKAE